MGLVKLNNSVSEPRILRIATFGRPRTGKTHFAATAPDPIGVVPLDRNTRATLAKDMAALGKDVYIPDQDFIRVGDPLALTAFQDKNEREGKKHYRAHVDRVKQCIWEMIVHPDVRTVVIDTGTALWEDILCANLGRSIQLKPLSRTVPNYEMQDLINSCGKHLIITHRASDVWESVPDPEKPGQYKDVRTGRYKLSGFSHLEFFCNITIEHFRLEENLTEVVNGKKVVVMPAGAFGARVSNCQAQPELIGDLDSTLWNSDVTFAKLGVMVYPETSEEDWE